MRFYTRQHRHYCGVDLHARSMYVCVLDREGNVLVSQNIASAPKRFWSSSRPIARTWRWRQSACSRGTGSPTCAHARASCLCWDTRYMRAIHGGKAKNDRIDAHKIAGLLRGARGQRHPFDRCHCAFEHAATVAAIHARQPLRVDWTLPQHRISRLNVVHALCFACP
jgi:hypothetical protein